MNQYWLNHLRKKEEEVNNKDLSIRLDKGLIDWKHIDQPDPYRLSVEPIGVKPKQKMSVIQRALEKTLFGDYMYLKHLEKRNPDVCIVTPDLSLILDSIHLFFELKNKGIPLLTGNNTFQWSKFHPQGLDISPEVKKYIQKHFSVFKKYLDLNVNGPRIEPDTLFYDKKIFDLILELMGEYEVMYDQETNEVTGLDKALVSCPNKKYLILFLNMNGDHANLLFVDQVNQTVERFEPHGSDAQDDVDQKLMDVFQGYSYKGPSEVCPRGIQGSMEQGFYEVKGFCQTWSFLYAVMRLEFPEVDSKYLDWFIQEMVKQYFEDKYNKRVEPDASATIEFLYDFIPDILENGNEIIDLVNQRLGTKWVLQGRTLGSTHFSLED